MQNEIEHQIDQQTKQCTDAVVDGENGKEEVSRLAFERVTTARATVQGHEPVSQGPHLKPGNKQRCFTADWAPQPEGVFHHPAKPFH
jgi:hypothetical protein